MMRMVEDMGRIGAFMIVAQTVIHLAAGRQYEKYIKVITGVMILFLLVAPFSAVSGDVSQYWQEQMRELERGLQAQSGLCDGQPYASVPAETVLGHIEEELRARLNDAIAGTGDQVTEVAVELEETIGEAGAEAARSWEFRCVKVTVEPEARADDPEQTAGTGAVRIDRIRVGDGKEEETGHTDGEDAVQGAYRGIFARTLGVAENRVEVTVHGSR